MNVYIKEVPPIIMDESIAPRDSYIHRFHLMKGEKKIGKIVVVDENEAMYIQEVDVVKEQRRKGYATMLMKFALKKYGQRKMSLIVASPDDEYMSDYALRKFYNKFGFKSRKKDTDFMERKADYSKS
jgi:ribosomal protein S18 acetylase RimI-like enzyme